MKKIINIACLLLILLSTISSCKKTNDHFVDFDLKMNEFEGSTWDYIYAQYGIYDSLIIAVERFPELKSYLKDSSNVTLFGVNNRSFEVAMNSLNKIRVQNNKKKLTIEDLGAEDLEKLLTYYILKGEYTTNDIKDLKDGQYVYGFKYNYQMHLQFQNTSASGLQGFGPQQIIFSDTNDRVFHMFWTRTTTSAINVKTSNGVVHMLNSGHDFGFNKLIKLFNN